MNIFGEVDENLFRPLTGTNKRKYVDILALIWDKCKRMPMYDIEKSTIFDMVEAYFYGLDEQVVLLEGLRILDGFQKRKASMRKNPNWPLITKLFQKISII